MTPFFSRLLRAPAEAASDLSGGLLALAFGGGVALLRGERPLPPRQGDLHRLHDLPRNRDNRGAMAG